MPLACKVLTEDMRPAMVELFEQRPQFAFAEVTRVGSADVVRCIFEIVGTGPPDDWYSCFHRRFDLDTRKRGPLRLGRNGIQLLFHFRGALAVGIADFLFPGVFGFLRPFLAAYQATATKQSVADGVAERDGVDRVRRLSRRPDFADQFVERIEMTVVRGDDAHLAAPDQQRVDRIEQLADILVEGRLVDDNNALQTTNVLGSGGQRLDPETRRESYPKGGDLLRRTIFTLIEENELFDGRQLLRDHAREMSDVADKFAALILGVADIEDVVTAGRTRRGGYQGVIERLGECDAGATALFAELQVVLVGQPVGLMLHKDAIG